MAEDKILPALEYQCPKWLEKLKSIITRREVHGKWMPVQNQTLKIPDSFTLITQNVWFERLVNEMRFPAQLEAFKSFKPDYICLQEVTLGFIQFITDDAWIRDNYVVSDTTGSSLEVFYGVMMLVHKRIGVSEFKLSKLPETRMGRWLIQAGFIGTAHFESNEQDVERRRAQFDFCRRAQLLCGDFNIYQDEPESASLKDLGWLDAYHEVGEENCREHTFGSFQAKQKDLRRIDRVLYQQELKFRPTRLVYFNDKEIVAGVWPSDHLGVFCEMRSK